MKQIWFCFLGSLLLASLCFAQKEKVVGMDTESKFDEKSASNMIIGEKVILSEKLAWEKLKGKDVKALGKLLSEDALDFDADGTIYTKSTLLEAVPKYEIADYSLEHFKVIVLGPEAAVVVYKATIKGTFQGKEISAVPLNMSTTWVKRHSDWLAVFHQETPMPASQ